MMLEIPNVQEVPVASLVWDATLYPRQQISEQHVNDLADALRAGECLPVIVIDAKTKRIVDGTHRWRAFRKVQGDESSVRCELREYATDAEMYLDAIEMNGAHGLGLNSFERTKCLLRMEELGIERETGLRALRMTAERAERMTLQKTAYRALPGGKSEPVVLKMGMENFRGETLNKKQQAVNRMSGGMRPSYYVDLVTGLVEAGICKRAPQELLRRLAKLRDVLADELPRKARRSA